MPSLKDLKNRIESVKSTRKITKAMQMVAAAKLRRAQEAAEAARPYATKFNEVVGSLASSTVQSDSSPRLLVGTGSTQTHLLVVLTSERGLCGGFNSNIVKKVKAHAEKLLADGKQIKIVTVGKKGRDQLKRDYAHFFVGHFDFSDTKNINYSNAEEVSRDILSRFNSDEFDIATIFFSKFISVVSQEPQGLQVIPAEFNFDDADKSISTFFEYEPEEEAILKDLLPRGVTTQIFTGLLENGASEQGARMSAMDNATRNAGDMIDRLTIQYNRSRQAVITNELIEIISGAEAL
ncbi:MAG: F0F1 ATP synthase subunit gamma [Aestuariivita sp.]|nr:F0F1 ATP synthase subunit gamma [Aestuariivita sp.]